MANKSTDWSHSYEQPDFKNDNIYEGPEGIYAQPEIVTVPTVQQSDKLPESSKTYKKKIIFAAFAFSVLLLIALMAWNKADLLELRSRVTATYTSDNTYRSSCLELMDDGHANDGLYIIKPSDDSSAEEVFCDMTTDGGGWTLIAGVHESDIKRKCDFHDLWSNYRDPERPEYTGEDSWGNEVTFGSAAKSTQRDYKSTAFMKSKASDIMVWHVQSEVPVTSMKSTSSLRYRTTSGFLQQYGGNLYSVYSDHYPLTTVKEIGTVPNVHQKTKEVLGVLVDHADHIKSQLPGWHHYQYQNGDTTVIVNAELYFDGSRYPDHDGNKVTVDSSKCSAYDLRYDKYHHCAESQIYCTSAKSYPFFAIGIIYNEERKEEYYSFKDWRSVAPTSFDISYSSGHRNEFKADGNPSNIVMGYTFLTRAARQEFQREELYNVSKIILQRISTISTLLTDFQLDNQTLSVPVIFDKGGNQEIMKEIPPNYKPNVLPGFIQFRAYNLKGYPNAFCAGIKPLTISPEYVCIGGMSTEIGEKGTCGDFAGWEGTVDDTVQTNQVSGSAHSQADFFSSIMIFCR